jgi:hypothetical protein
MFFKRLAAKLFTECYKILSDVASILGDYAFALIEDSPESGLKTKKGINKMKLVCM